MRRSYNADISDACTPDSPEEEQHQCWLSAMQFNPARLIPDRCFTSSQPLFRKHDSKL